MVYDLTKKNIKNRGNVSCEIIKLAIACMKRTPDSIRKTAIAKEKVDHDITVGYQLCNGTKSLYRRSGSQVEELPASCMRHLFCEHKTIRKETHTKRKKQKATVWTHTPEKNLVGRQKHEREKLRKALIPKQNGQHVKNRNKQTEGDDTFCLVCFEQWRKDERNGNVGHAMLIMPHWAHNGF